ncbi:DUF485 domain-containing protein [Amycolatopsis thermoflava]|uniref:DUF485 domain-containing protein n=1 Tax=Amycolatopsis thermoflava TaxID=84480 RepID=UPI003D724989
MEGPLVAGAEQSGSGNVGALLAHPDLARLIADRRRFFAYAWSVFLVAAVLLFGAAAFAPAVLGHILAPGISVGLVAGLLYVALIFVLTVQYARRARGWDAIVARLRAAAGYRAGVGEQR